jgi:serine/threonine kinase 16
MASYRAPELIETPSECVIDGKADVWAVGCTLHAIMFSRSPFESGTSDGFSVLAALSANWTSPPRHPWPPSWIEVLGSCLKASSAERLGVVELLDKVKGLPLNVNVSKPQEWEKHAAPHEEGGWAKFE